MRVNPNVKIRSQNSRASDTEKVLIHLDSRAVAMEVGICQGVCNNSPAEWISPENFWRYSEIPILDHWGKCASSNEQEGVNSVQKPWCEPGWNTIQCRSWWQQQLFK
eukprot:TRINITY_DN0_c2_g1_i3.p4 TRINITY_DN0_c2_g1~~TRINITY_DN0_c2_g1_i3.p4  ORF type:complete len:107 (-),score=0.56 TRINITY_DN0_c2_g1_i3:456-776(-)